MRQEWRTAAIAIIHDGTRTELPRPEPSNRDWFQLSDEFLRWEPPEELRVKRCCKCGKPLKPGELRECGDSG